MINDRDGSGLSVSRFQNTDLPHPDWEEIVLTGDSRSPTPHAKSEGYLETYIKDERDSVPLLTRSKTI